MWMQNQRNNWQWNLWFSILVISIIHITGKFWYIHAGGCFTQFCCCWGLQLASQKIPMLRKTKRKMSLMTVKCIVPWWWLSCRERSTSSVVLQLRTLIEQGDIKWVLLNPRRSFNDAIREIVKLMKKNHKNLT